MILFDLKCSSDHVFEAWFADSASYEKQVRKKAVECPVCGDTKVTKALMAPRIAARSDRARTAEKQTAVMPADDQSKAATLLRELRDHVEANCDYVGETFPEEARKIHYGETEKRNIYGEASAEDAQALRDEGVEVSQLPWLPKRNS
jgi:hypothetical protein